MSESRSVKKIVVLNDDNRSRVSGEPENEDKKQETRAETIVSNLSPKENDIKLEITTKKVNAQVSLPIHEMYKQTINFIIPFMDSKSKVMLMESNKFSRKLAINNFLYYYDKTLKKTEESLKNLKEVKFSFRNIMIQNYLQKFLLLY